MKEAARHDDEITATGTGRADILMLVHPGGGGAMWRLERHTERVELSSHHGET